MLGRFGIFGVSVIDAAFFFFQAEDGIRDVAVTGVQTCALPISLSIRAVSVARGGSVGTSCDLVSALGKQFSKRRKRGTSSLNRMASGTFRAVRHYRSEEHTSELQSRLHLVCRLLLEKRKPPRATARPPRRERPQFLADLG